MDPQIEKARHRLEEAQFSLQPLQAPDAKSFGNWILIGTRDHLAVRVTNDRGDILLDLMPRHPLAIEPNEPGWFTYDVVARALGIDLRPEQDTLQSLFDHFCMIDEAFSANKWDKTGAILAAVEEEKRRRFIAHRR